MPPLQLGVFDLGKAHEGRGSEHANWAQKTLSELVELAKESERLGYSRFWMTEHHTGDSSVACPELPLVAVGTGTTRISLGTACTIVPYSSPLRIAESFRLLEAMFPGRIEVGLGRGPGAEPPTARALVDDRPELLTAESFERKIGDAVSLLRGERPGSAVARPKVPRFPNVWHMGVGPETMARCASHSMGFCFGYFLFALSRRPHDEAAESDLIREHYVRRFRTSPHVPGPKVSLAVTAMCAPTEAEARALDRQSQAARMVACDVVGTPQQCRERLESMASTYGTREIVIANTSRDFKKKLRSFRLLAAECGLGSTPQAAVTVR